MSRFILHAVDGKSVAVIDAERIEFKSDENFSWAELYDVDDAIVGIAYLAEGQALLKERGA